MRILSIFCVLGVLGCACPENNATISEDVYLDKLLNNALDDALVPEEDEVLVLHDIRTDSIYSISGIDYIKAVTWINDTYLENWKDSLKKSDRRYTIKKADIAIWLTIVPQLKDFCSTTFFKSEKDLEVRLKQKLGLNYKEVYSHFVEVFVPLSHLRRPCLNPDVGLTFCLPCTMNETSYSQAEFYYEWRQNINKKNEFPVPFTGLGYTYDWGPGDSEKGFSEFVFITDGVTPLLVESVNSTLDYCAK